MITSLHINGYKNTNNIRLTDLVSINFLVGKNASGKSSILEGFRIVSTILDGSVHGGIQVPGLTGYALREGFEMSLYFDNDRYFTIKIPEGTSINIGNGSFGALPDPLTIHGASVEDDNGTRRVLVKKRTGKSMIAVYVTPFAEIIDNGGYVIQPNHMGFDFNNISLTNEKDLVEFLNKYYPIQENEKVTDISSTIRDDKAIQFSISKTEDNTLIRKVAFTQVSGGLRSITRFYFGITQILDQIKNDRGYDKVICIEEPENGFHPSLQKELPKILNDFIGRYNDLQFIVTTHSPFIISEASKLINSKVYLIDQGRSINLAMDNQEVSSGHSGSNILNVVSELLGAGFSDLAVMPRTSEVMSIVYCEGSSKSDVTDSFLYRKIFPDKIFVSCGGLNDAVNAYNIARVATKFVFGKDTSVVSLVDRSYSAGPLKVGPRDTDFISPTGPGKVIFSDGDRDKFINSDKNKGLKMLVRKEIENYIFDPKIVDLLPIKDRARIFFKSTSIDYIHGEVKDKVSAPKEIKLKLAQLIYKHRGDAAASIYVELYNCLK